MNDQIFLDPQFKKIIIEVLNQTDLSLDRIRHEINHSLTTLFWLTELSNNLTLDLQAAALLHDVDRFFSMRREKMNSFVDYNQYKQAHALRSAEIAQEILTIINFSGNKNEVFNLIKLHEVGGNKDADLLRDADSLAFFDKNIGDYVLNRDWSVTMEKIEFMYSRMGSKSKEILKIGKFDCKLIPQVADFLNQSK